MDEGEEKHVHTRLLWILSLSLLILVFVFFQIDYTMFVPAGKFSETLEVTECSFTGLTVIGVGDTQEEALADHNNKKLLYAHLYCNGKFPNDPPDTAIHGVGCTPCKPDCKPEVTDIGEVVYSKTPEDKTTATRRVRIHCRI